VSIYTTRVLFHKTMVSLNVQCSSSDAQPVLGSETMQMSRKIYSISLYVTTAE